MRDEGGGRPPGNIREALRHVDHIRSELRNVLDEIQEVVRILEQAEREKTASEDEIDQLRESLRHLHRDQGQMRYSRPPASREVPAREAAPTEEEPEREID